MKKHFGFTLGEIMIALTVIGIVAVLILPQLILGQRTSKAATQFNTAYSTISKVASALESDNKFLKTDTYEKLKSYSRVKTDCGNSDDASKNNTNICNIDTTYSTFNATKTVDTSYFSDGSFVLKNGMLVAVKNDVGQSENPENEKGILISIDINGKNQAPNQWGWDLFTFEAVNDEILPEGAPGTKQYGKDLCKTDLKTTNNGLTCAYNVLSNENYFDVLYKGY